MLCCVSLNHGSTGKFLDGIRGSFFVLFRNCSSIGAMVSALTCSVAIHRLLFVGEEQFEFFSKSRKPHPCYPIIRRIFSTSLCSKGWCTRSQLHYAPFRWYCCIVRLNAFTSWCAWIVFWLSWKGFTLCASFFHWRLYLLILDQCSWLWCDWWWW